MGQNGRGSSDKRKSEAPFYEEGRDAEQKKKARKVERSVEEQSAASFRVAVRAAYSAIEREMFTDPPERERIQEVLALTRVQIADDAATSDRQRFAGKRTLSLDGFAETGYEMSLAPKPSYATREEQEALEFGMKPFLDTLTKEQLSAVQTIFQYSHAYREGAKLLHIKTAALQRRIRSAAKAVRKALEETFGPVPEGLTEPNRYVLSEDDAAFYERSRETSNALRGLGHRAESTLDMTPGRLGKFDPGTAIPRRALTPDERTWLSTGRREP